MIESDLDTTDVENSDVTDTKSSDNVEFLDTSDIHGDPEFLDAFDICGNSEFLDTSDVNKETESIGEPELNESTLEKTDKGDISVNNEDASDGVYHAKHMSPDTVAEIDNLWRDTFDRKVEPYKATKNTDDATDIEAVEPYRATRQSDTQDFASDLDASGDTNDLLSPLSLDEQFAFDVEAMSFDDLRVEQERLDQLSQMEDLDIFASYDAAQNGKYDPELMSALTDGLPRETLEHLKAGLATGDPEVYDYFGLGNETETGNDDFTRTRKR